jgi:hypothetical protein
MNNLKQFKDFVQDTVDKGITSVEEIHREIMNQPFYIIERMMPPDLPVKQVRKMQEQVIGSIYSMIRIVNKTVGDIADGILAHEKKGHVTPPQYHRPSTSVQSRKPQRRRSKRR